MILVWLHFILYTAIASIKVHMEATGALCLETLLTHKRVHVHCTKISIPSTFALHLPLFELDCIPVGPWLMDCIPVDPAGWR